jgi:hypothetical protein
MKSLGLLGSVQYAGRRWESKMAKKNTPINITIDPIEFQKQGKQRDKDAAKAMRMFAKLMVGIDDRMTPESVEVFLSKKGL